MHMPCACIGPKRHSQLNHQCYHVLTTLTAKNGIVTLSFRCSEIAKLGLNNRAIKTATMIFYSSAAVVNFITTLSLFATTAQSQQTPPPPQEHVLWSIFEDVLVNSSGALYNLSMIFFKPDSWDDGGCGGSSSGGPDVAVSVGVTVDRVDNAEFVPRIFNDTPGLCCHTNMGYCTNWINCEDIVLALRQPSTVGASQIFNLLGGQDINSVLAAFDPVFYYLMKHLSDESLGLSELLSFQETTWITLHIDSLDVMPSTSEIRNALSMVFMWVSIYILPTLIIIL